MKIIVTGGHHNSALIVARSLRDLGYSITWVGHRYTMVADPHDSLEYQEVTASGFKFIPTLAGKFHPRVHPIHFLRLPLGFIQALWLLIKIHPQLILSFGGYVAVPLAVIGKLLGITVITFEQTTSIGRANQLISLFAKICFLAWPSSLKYFPKHRSLIAGLPIRQDLLKPSSQSQFAFSRRLPTLLITGGKQGSHVINQTIFQILPQLIHEFNIIHQTGASLQGQDSDLAEQIHRSLPQNLRPFYIHKPHFLSDDMVAAIKSSQLVITRAGAHIVYELLLLHKPAVLIPLPFSYNNEQHHNALIMTQTGLGVILPQAELSPDRLVKALGQIRRLRLKSKPPLSLPVNATQTIVDYITHHFPHDSSVSTS